MFLCTSLSAKFHFIGILATTFSLVSSQLEYHWYFWELFSTATYLIYVLIKFPEHMNLWLLKRYLNYLKAILNGSHHHEILHLLFLVLKLFIIKAMKKGHMSKCPNSAAIWNGVWIFILSILNYNLTNFQVAILDNNSVNLTFGSLICIGIKKKPKHLIKPS
jgi:hypothetical protein